MGVFWHKTCGVIPTASRVRRQAPDPARFEILQTKQVGSSLVARVSYSDCTNYEGIKIMVYEHTWDAEFRTRSVLDPHFRGFNPGHPSPVARFEPTDRGWIMACAFVREILRQ